MRCFLHRRSQRFGTPLPGDNGRSSDSAAEANAFSGKFLMAFCLLTYRLLTAAGLSGTCTRFPFNRPPEMEWRTNCNAKVVKNGGNGQKKQEKTHLLRTLFAAVYNREPIGPWTVFGRTTVDIRPSHDRGQVTKTPFTDCKNVCRRVRTNGIRPSNDMSDGRIIVLPCFRFV